MFSGIHKLFSGSVRAHVFPVGSGPYLNGPQPGVWGTCGQRNLRRPHIFPLFRRVLQSCWHPFARADPLNPFEDGRSA